LSASSWFEDTRNSYYWTSSPVAGFAARAWDVNFDSGYVGSYGRSNGDHVRLVR